MIVLNPRNRPRPRKNTPVKNRNAPKGPMPKAVLAKLLAQKQRKATLPRVSGMLMPNESAKRAQELAISRRPIPSKPRNPTSIYSDLVRGSERIKLLTSIKDPAFRNALKPLMINSEARQDKRIGFENLGTGGFKPVLSVEFFKICKNTPEAMEILKSMIIKNPNWNNLTSYDKRIKINALETLIYSLGKEKFKKIVNNKEKRGENKRNILEFINNITGKGYRLSAPETTLATFNAKESMRILSPLEMRANAAKVRTVLKRTRKLNYLERATKEKLLKSLESKYGYTEETKARLELLAKKGRLNPRQKILLEEILSNKRITFEALTKITKNLMNNGIINNEILTKLFSVKEGVFVAYNLSNNVQGQMIYNYFTSSGYGKSLFNNLISTPEGVKKLNRSINNQGKRVFYAKLMAEAKADGTVWNIIEHFIKTDVVKLTELPKPIADKLKDAIKIMKTSIKKNRK